MSTKNPKSKNTETETLEIDSVVESSKKQAVDKKDTKKSSAAKTSEVIETKESVEKVEHEVTSSTKKKKSDKGKVIRDSFSFPEQDYLKITELKKTCLAEGVHVKKGELLRAGLHLLTKLSLAELKQTIEQVEKVKTGRPNA